MPAILEQDGQQLGGDEPTHTRIFEIAIVRPERHIERCRQGPARQPRIRIAPFDTTPRLSDRPRIPPRWIDSQRQQIQRVLQERLLNTQFPRDAGHVSLNLNDHAFGNSELADSALEEDPPRLPPRSAEKIGLASTASRWGGLKLAKRASLQSASAS